MNPIDLTVSLALQKAEIDALRSTLKRFAQELNLQEIDGIQVPQWIQNQTAKELERLLLDIGDRNLPVYQKIKDRLDDLSRKLN